jgi:hypothetical protein
MISPGVVKQPLHPPQAQPVCCLPDQPGRGASPSERLVDVEVADVCLTVQLHEPPALSQVRLHLDVAQHLVVKAGG